MPSYSIYQEQPSGGYKAIKSGVRIGAFVFGPFWAVYVQLWWLAAAWSVAAAASIALSGSGFILLDVGLFILMLAAVFKGEDWETARYLNEGYAHVGDVATAHDEEHAVSVFLMNPEGSAPAESSGPSLRDELRGDELGTGPVPETPPPTRLVPRKPSPPEPEPPARAQPASGLVERAQAFRELRAGGMEEAEAKRLAGLE